MQALLPTDDLLFLMDLSIDPVHAARGAGTVTPTLGG